jgi:DNA-binding transcriptional MerR regulator
MTIGELAAKAAVNIQTIRFYERRGILAAPARSASGYRQYVDRDLETLCFIRRSQELGFTLQEITELVPLHHSIAHPRDARSGGPRAIQEMAAAARRRLQQVDEKIFLLRAMRRQLRKFADALEKAPPGQCLAPSRSTRSRCG